MTVRELRRALFEIDNQEATVFLMVDGQPLELDRIEDTVAEAGNVYLVQDAA